MGLYAQMEFVSWNIGGLGWIKRRVIEEVLNGEGKT